MLNDMEFHQEAFKTKIISYKYWTFVIIKWLIGKLRLIGIDRVLLDWIISY